MNDKIKKLKAEFEEIRKIHKGKFSPKDVVEYARNKNTELHSRFEWDNKIAGDQYRIEQAKSIIRQLKITVIERENEIIKIREYSSLTTERGPNGSYRSTVNILSDNEMKAQLIEDIQNELVRINIRLKIVSIVASRYIDKAVAVTKTEIKKIKSSNQSQARSG